jgi:hypothetical protein
VPQAPQSFGLVLSLTQAPEQQPRPLPHWLSIVQAPHPPLVQTWPGEHWLFEVQMQTPLAQLWPFGQTFPHVPQLLGSVWVLVQTPLQAVWPVGHIATHSPLEQSWPAGQATPGPQVHWPLEQVPLGQLTPQAPQLV